MKLSIHLIKKEDDHFNDVTEAHEAKPGETVEGLVERLLTGESIFNEGEANYSARIEIRLVKEA
jgi:hypothetical protein